MHRNIPLIWYCKNINTKNVISKILMLSWHSILIQDDIVAWERFSNYFPRMIGIRQSRWFPSPWWRHQIETFSASLALCAGNSPVPGEFPSQRPVTRSFDAFFDLRMNKQLSKQPWGWWFETASRSLWRHCNDYWQVKMTFYVSCLSARISCCTNSSVSSDWRRYDSFDIIVTL